jgi:hypothetical protein
MVEVLADADIASLRGAALRDVLQRHGSKSGPPRPRGKFVGLDESGAGA